MRLLQQINPSVVALLVERAKEDDEDEGDANNRKLLDEGRCKGKHGEQGREGGKPVRHRVLAFLAPGVPPLDDGGDDGQVREAGREDEVPPRRLGRQTCSRNAEPKQQHAPNVPLCLRYRCHCSIVHFFLFLNTLFGVTSQLDLSTWRVEPGSMSQFRALSEEVEGSDDEGSFDLGGRPLTPRPLTPQDEETVTELDDMYNCLVSGQEDAARNAQPGTPSKDPNDPRGCRGSGTGGPRKRLQFPETPEDCLDMMKAMGDTFAKTVAAQETAQAEIQSLEDRVKKHEMRIAELENTLAFLLAKKTKVAASRKRLAEKATGEGPSKRTAS